MEFSYYDTSDYYFFFLTDFISVFRTFQLCLNNYINKGVVFFFLSLSGLELLGQYYGYAKWRNPFNFRTDGLDPCFTYENAMG